MLPNTDRKTAGIMAAGGIASLAMWAYCIKLGYSSRHPVLGIVGGFFASVSTGAIVMNAGRMIVGPSIPTSGANLASGSPNPATNTAVN